MGSCLSSTTPPPAPAAGGAAAPVTGLSVSPTVESPAPYPSLTPSVSPAKAELSSVMPSPPPRAGSSNSNKVADMPLDDPRNKSISSVIPQMMELTGLGEPVKAAAPLSASAVTIEDGVPLLSDPLLAPTAFSASNRLNSMLIDRALAKHRVVDIDLLPPPATGISAAAGEEDTRNVVGGGYSRRSTWNTAAVQGQQPQHGQQPRTASGTSTPIDAHRRLASEKYGGAASITIVAPSISGSSLNSSPMQIGVQRARMNDDSPERTPSAMAGLPPHLRQGSTSARDAGMRSGMTHQTSQMSGSATSSPMHGSVMSPNRALSPSSFHQPLAARTNASSRPESPDRGGPFLLEPAALIAMPSSPPPLSPIHSAVKADASCDPRGMVLNDRRHHTTKSEARASLGTSGATGGMWQSLGAPNSASSSSLLLASGTGAVSSVPASRRSTRGRTRGRKLALLIDSTPLTQRLTSVALHRSGFTACDVATDGESGAAMARAQRYDLILIETALPAMSGVDTARAIRFYEQHTADTAAASGLPPSSIDPPAILLALTVAVDADSLAAYKSAGFNGAIERGAIVVEAVHDAMDTLARAPGFLLMAVGGVKTQQTGAQATTQTTHSASVSRAASPMLSALGAAPAPHARMPSTSLRRDPQQQMRRGTGGIAAANAN